MSSSQAMSPAPGLMLAALAFWGLQTGLVIWGVGLGCLLEAARWAHLRWELGPEDFRRLWNVTVLLFLGAGLFLFSSYEGWGAMVELVRDPTQAAAPLRNTSRGLLQLLQWLPILFFPFLFAHALSHADRLPWESVSPLLHARQKRRQAAFARRETSGFHPAYPYWVLVLFSASADHRHPNWYFPGLALLVAWALWPYRSRQFRWATWVATISVAAALAYVGQRGLLGIYRQLERLEARWLNDWSNSQFDAQGVMTDLESIKRGKGSGQIVLRLEAPGGTPPALLREAAFTHFQSPNWNAIRHEFEPVLPEVDGTTWRLGTARAPRAWLRIWRYSRRGDLALALPAGTAELRDLAAGVIETNRLAAARIIGGAKLVSYTASHGPGNGFVGAPDPEDTSLNRLRPPDRDAISEVATELGLANLTPRAALDRIAAHFLSGFTYSLDAKNPGEAGATGSTNSALGIFLLRDRQGHCEFFATATTLLLRTAGVPARYVVGHSVQERKGDTFVVRRRHAHSWTEAFVDGQWLTVDNTPVDWQEVESARVSIWEPFYDQLSAAWLAFTRWRQGEGQWRTIILSVGLAVLTFMGWKELRGGRWRRIRALGNSRPKATGRTESDSEFYRVVNALERQMAPRPQHTSLRDWMTNLPWAAGVEREQLMRLLELHYRLRFDPVGLSVEERARLKSESLQWLRTQSGRGLVGRLTAALRG